ncbi:uncharacterized protein [Diadema setosum]|uniref:uncharacterized protein n=1 Tax=Diadema setosum TaxID=31175 RepID=UPI003B3A009A
MGQNELDPVGSGVCTHMVSRLDTVVTSAIQSRVVPYNGACSWLHHITGCQVYKVTFQPVYKRTTKVNYRTEYKCCSGWKRKGQSCEKLPTVAPPNPPQGPNGYDPSGPHRPGYPAYGPGTGVGRPGLGGRGQRPNNPGPGFGVGGFGPGAGFVPRPGFGPGTPAERTNYGPGYGPGPGAGNGFNPRPGFEPTGQPGGPVPPNGPNAGPQPPQQPQGPQGPQGGGPLGPPVGPMAPGSGRPHGGNAGGAGGRTNTGGAGSDVRPGLIPGRVPGQGQGAGPTGEGNGGTDQQPSKNTGSGSIVTIMGALLGVFGVFGLGAVLMMYLSRKRDSSGRRSVRLRRSSFRDAAGRDETESRHKSWKFSIYQFRLQ